MFKVGQAVLVLPLKKSGTIVAIKKKSFLVKIGSIDLDCKEKDLKFIEKKTKKKNSIPKGTFAAPQLQAKRNVPTALDLHGETVSTAVERTAQFVSDSIVAGLKEITIVHGIGTGKLKKAVHEYLKSEIAVKNFRLSTGNNGSTVVNL